MKISDSKTKISLMMMAIILSVGLMNHVFLIPLIIGIAHRDAWVSVLMSVVPLIAIAFLLYFIMNGTKQAHLATWLQKKTGFIPSWIFRLFGIIYMSTIAILTIKDTAIWTKISYLPRTPLFVISTVFILVCFLAVWGGFHSLMIIAGALLPFVVIFGEFVMLANMQYKHYDRLFPLFEHGYTPMLKGVLYASAGYAELIIILFLQHHLVKKVKLSHILWVSFIMLGLICGPLLGAIASFGPFEAAKQRYPAFEQWRLVSIGKYVEHVDFLSIYQWLSGAFIRVSLALYIICEQLTIMKRKRPLIGVSLVTLILIIISAFPLSDIKLFQFWRLHYFPYSVPIVFCLLVILLIIVLIVNKKGGHQSESKQGEHKAN